MGGHSQSLVGVLPGEQGLALSRLVRLRRRRRAVVEPVVVVVVVAVVVAAEEAVGLAAAPGAAVHHLGPVVVGRVGRGRLEGAAADDWLQPKRRTAPTPA